MSDDRLTGSGRVALFALTIVATATSCSGGADNHDGTDSPDCENRGDTYYAGIMKATDDGTIQVAISSAEPAPPANTANNNWSLTVTDAATGATIPGATVVVAPYMVDHGHGAPNVIGDDMGDGRYQINMLYLKMNGLWTITTKVTPSAGQEHRAVFSFCVRPL